ncbi:uncharacterized protein LOC134272526 [Saccostrea cucullata]|uniref:uncharacterized protein LOC134272526 n=1 Tax=Saccostrea cuccullata TaxID=36930 RepID=UPI002ED51AA5
MNIFWSHIFMIYMIHKIYANPCRASIPTEQIVSRCPQSEKDWQKAAERKQCREIAVIQNCTKPANFVYHCLLNEDITHFVEVCAPVFNINGYCAKYDTKEHRVYHFTGHDCTKDNPPCKPFYKSSEAYKYTSCYDLVQKNKTTTSTIHQNLGKSDNLYKNISIILGCILLLSMGVHVVLGYWLYRKRNIKCGDELSCTFQKNTKRMAKKKEEKLKEEKIDVPQDMEIKAAETQKYNTERERKQLNSEKKVTSAMEIFKNMSGSNITASESGTPKIKPKEDVRNCNKAAVNADEEEASKALLQKDVDFTNTEEDRYIIFTNTEEDSPKTMRNRSNQTQASKTSEAGSGAME